MRKPAIKLAMKSPSQIEVLQPIVMQQVIDLLEMTLGAMPSSEADKVVRNCVCLLKGLVSVEQNMTTENIVSMYMNALGESKLSQAVWKQLANVNQKILGSK